MLFLECYCCFLMKNDAFRSECFQVYPVGYQAKQGKWGDLAVPDVSWKAFFSAGIVVPVMYLRPGTLYLSTAWAIKSRKPTLSTKERGRLQRTVNSVIFSEICLAASLFSFPLLFPTMWTDQGLFLRSIPLSLASSCLSLEVFVFVHMFRLQMFDQVRGIVTARFYSTSRNFLVANLAFGQCTRRHFYHEILPHRRDFLLLVCFCLPTAWKSCSGIGLEQLLARSHWSGAGQ